MAVSDAIAAKTFDQEACNRIIHDLSRRFVSGDGLNGEMRLIDRIRWRRQHFFNLEQADPVLSAPWDKSNYRRQTTQLNSIHADLKARLKDPSPLVRCEAHPDTATNRSNAEDLAAVLNTGWGLVQERTGRDVIGDLIDGMVMDAYGVLHWCKAADLWPEVPEYQYVEDLPADDGEKARYSNRRKKVLYRNGKPLADGETEDGAEPRMVYKERPQSLAERHRYNKARAGFPWYIEAVDPATVYWQRDRSLAEGESMVIVVREIGVLDYADQLRKSDGLTLSLNEMDKSVSIYSEQDAPDVTLPSSSNWGYTVGIAQIWTRDEFYELTSSVAANGSIGNYGGQWTLVKSHQHPYERPPFAIVPAFEVNVADPSLHYQPVLNNMYQVKPRLDHKMALLDVLTESTAIPLYYLNNIQTGMPKLTEDGSRIELTADAASAYSVPDGYELKELRPDVTPGYVQSVEYTKQEMEEAKPGTGQADVSAATKPWTARISVQQANVQPSLLIGNIAHGLSTMFRNMAKVMSKSAEDGGFGEEIVVFSHTEGNKTTRLVGIAPEDIQSLDVSVEMSKVSAPERITLEEHGRDLLNDPKVGLTRIEYIEDYEGKPNAEDVDAMRKATALVEQFIQLPWFQQKAAAWLGKQFLMGPDGQDIGAGGQSVTPEQIAAANGITPMQQPQMQPQAQGPQMPPPQMAGLPTQPPQAVQPAMPALNTPGTIPLGGQQG